MGSSLQAPVGLSRIGGIIIPGDASSGLMIRSRYVYGSLRGGQSSKLSVGASTRGGFESRFCSLSSLRGMAR